MLSRHCTWPTTAKQNAFLLFRMLATADFVGRNKSTLYNVPMTCKNLTQVVVSVVGLQTEIPLGITPVKLDFSGKDCSALIC